MDNLYPISLNLKNTLCVVIGGGKVATRKIQKLLACGATVKVVSPHVVVELEYLLKESVLLTWIPIKYTGIDLLKGAALIFATTNNPAINEQIRLDANTLGTFVNVANHASLGDFITPASFSQGDLQISVSTSGKVPGLTKHLKETLKDTFTPEYEPLITILGQLRQAAIKDTPFKAENLTTLRNIIQNYTTILDDLTTGTDPNTITQSLLDQIKDLV